MKFVRHGIFVIIAGVFLSACGQPTEPTAPETARETDSQPTETGAHTTVDSQPQSESDVLLAEWDGGRIYQSQLAKILKSRINELKRSLHTQDQESLQDLVEHEKREILEVLIDNYIMVREAHSRGLGLTPLEKENLLKQVRGMYGSEEAYEQAMQQAGQEEEDLLRIMSTIELSKKCKNDQQKKFLEDIDQAQMKEFYQNNLDKFTPPQRTSFNRVTIYFGDGRSKEEAETLATRLHEDVQEQWQAIENESTPQTPEEKKEQFKKKRKVLQNFAQQHSDSPDAGYNYGYVTVYHNEEFSAGYSEELLEEARHLQVGELSKVVLNEDQKSGQSSYQFFMVIEQVPTRRQPFDSEPVQSLIPNMMLQEKMSDWKEQLRDTYNVKIYEEKLNEMKGLELETESSVSE